MPVEVGDGLLQPQQVVDRAHDDVYGGGVPSLSPQVVLEGEVVTFAEKLQEAEETNGKGVVRENLTHD